MRTRAALITLALTLSAVPAFARQAAPGQKPPAAPTAQQKPPAPQQPAAAPRPFPEGAKIAICSLEGVAALSKEGQAAFAKVKALNDAKVKELEGKTKAMEANRSLAQSAAVTDEKRAALEKEVARQQVEIDRLKQDATAEVNDLQNEVRDAFIRKVMPIIAQVATERGLHMVLNYQDGMTLWVDTGLDVSAEVARRLDAAGASVTKR